MKTRPNTSYTETPIRVAILIDGGYFIKRYNAMYTQINSQIISSPNPIVITKPIACIIFVKVLCTGISP